MKPDRLPLTDAISVDEVFLDMDDNYKYALVIQNFHTGDPIALLRSRRATVTESYFISIPAEERGTVPVVDSFHVIQWITRMIANYIRQLIRKFRQRDPLPLSDEVYLLQKFRWLVLANQSNIRYRSDPRMDPHFHVLMSTYDYEDALFRIDPDLKDYRDLKELYIQFNSRNSAKPLEARNELSGLIRKYRESKHEMFRDFASLLEKYEDPIINSFIMVERIGNGKIYDRRLSNGPIESINRKVKDLKRLGRGFQNFEHFRNRFLYAARSVPVLNGVTDYNPAIYFEDNDF